jgi:glycerol kinase
MRWLLDHCHEVRSANENGSLVFGTIDTWLIYVRSRCIKQF